MITGILAGSTALILQDFLVQAQSVGDEMEQRTVETAIEAYIALDMLGGSDTRQFPEVE